MGSDRPSPPRVPRGQIAVVLAIAASVVVDRSLPLTDREKLYLYVSVISLATLLAIYLDLMLPYRRSRP